MRWLGLALAYLLVAGLVMAVLVQQPVARLASIAESANRAKYVGVALQALAGSLIVTFWPGIVRWAAGRSVVAAQEVDQLLAWRWRLLGWLLLFLLLVGVGVSDLVRIGSHLLQILRGLGR